MKTDPNPTLIPPPAPDRKVWRPIRFAGRRDRKLKAWLPDSSNLHGAALGSANMVRVAIRDRAEATRRVHEAERLRQCGGWRNERDARRDLTLARVYREKMRQAALWARVFAQHVANDDPRLEVLAQRQSERLVLMGRAMVWSDRWSRVLAVQDRAIGNAALLARCIRLLRLIATRHDALDPLGYTLSENLDN